MIVERVLEEAGHFALVETDEGFAIQFGGVRVNDRTRIASRVGTDHDIRLCDNFEHAQNIYNDQMNSLLREFKTWGTN
jgi:hypothetical protein